MYCKIQTKKANRTLRIDSQTNELMRRHGISKKEVYLAYPNYKKPELPLVFHSPNGTRLRTSIVRDYLRDACKKSGVQHISPHVLRHTHAIHLLEAGADVKYVVDCLGHSDTKITLNIYLHVSKKIEQDSLILYERHLKSKYMIQPSKENTT
ncbi:tyrosine-type recombinase/integrase [Exiguobacterium sp. s151]|uniref:tyrosine-type recombinase/integrase n=1 Tax=Exiguobacterium sp. s151 TaxID=2751229 RepID=UPI00333A2DBA